jgi:hypothetical protein
MQSMLLTMVLSLVLLVALAGVIYPFKPFKRRSMALLTSVVLFFLIGILAPEQGERNLGRSKDELSANTESTVAMKIGEPTPSASATQPTEKVRVQAVPDNTRNEIIATIQRAEWAEARRLITQVDTRNFDFAALVSDAERAALEVVKPLPSSDYSGNEDGYRFLAALIPGKLQYEEKADDYAEKRRIAVERSRKAAISRLRTEIDKIEGITWYQHPNAPRYVNSRSTVYLYIGRHSGERPWLRMKIQYEAEDWLFVDSVDAWYDGLKETLYLGNFERDHKTTIWEWVDVVPTARQLEILRSIADAKEAILRFRGMQYHRDVKISSGDKMAIREILIAFDAMEQ